MGLSLRRVRLSSRVVGVVFPFQEWSRRIVTTVYPIFFGDPQGGELRTRPRARAARAHAGARSALFFFSVKIDSSLKLPLLTPELAKTAKRMKVGDSPQTCFLDAYILM